MKENGIESLPFSLSRRSNSETNKNIPAPLKNNRENITDFSNSEGLSETKEVILYRIHTSGSRVPLKKVAVLQIGFQRGKIRSIYPCSTNPKSRSPNTMCPGVRKAENKVKSTRKIIESPNNLDLHFEAKNCSSFVVSFSI